MNIWQTIETAPKDDKTLIDLWVTSSRFGETKGYRVPNARRIYDAGRYPDVWVDSKGYYVNVSRYYDEEGDECLQLGNTPHPKAKWSVKVTHWMSVPKGPDVT